MTAAKHTAGPLTVGAEIAVKNPRASFLPVLAGGSTFALVPTGNGRSAANAALIVRAVNSHDAFVAALLDLLEGEEPWDVRATRARAALR